MCVRGAWCLVLGVIDGGGVCMGCTDFALLSSQIFPFFFLPPPSSFIPIQVSEAGGQGGKEEEEDNAFNDALEAMITYFPE